MKNVAFHYHTCISSSQRAGCRMECEWQNEGSSFPWRRVMEISHKATACQRDRARSGPTSPRCLCLTKQMSHCQQNEHPVKKKKIWNGSFIEWRRTSHIGLIFILTYILQYSAKRFLWLAMGDVCKSCSLLPYSCGSLTFQILWSNQNRKYQLVLTVFPPFFEHTVSFCLSLKCEQYMPCLININIRFCSYEISRCGKAP